MRQTPVTIVNITSPSYTGTTWLCLLLGSHPRALTVGPPDRVWGLRDAGFADACRVHGKDCGFWSGFAERYDPGRNFYVQLADYADKDYIVINNPTPAHEKAEMRHPDIVIKPIRIVRDGRALACSFSRHLKVDMHDAIREHIRPLFGQFPLETDRDDMIGARYEDVLGDQRAWLERFGRFIGIEYPADALEFWTYDHHMTSGNAGTMALLKFFQGIEVRNFKDRGFYESQFERMRAGEKSFDDQRWRGELGRRELYQFDRYCGVGNAAWGYEADAFTSVERADFEAELDGKAPVAESRPTSQKSAGVDDLVAFAKVLSRKRGRLLAMVGAAWAVSIVAVGVIMWALLRGGG